MKHSTYHQAKQYFLGTIISIMAFAPANARAQTDATDNTSPFYTPSKPNAPKSRNDRESDLPPQRRGYAGASVAFMTGIDSRHRDNWALALNLAGSIPLPRHFFIDLKASGLQYRDEFIFGSPWIGARHVQRRSPIFWVDLGLDVGIPVPPPTNSPYWYETELLYYMHGGWDMQRFLPQTVPLRGHATLDISMEVLLMRIEVVPLVTIDVASSREPSTSDVYIRSRHTSGLHLQHAIELQSQGWIGGGLRLQLVLQNLPQILPIPAVEPYAYLEREKIYARLGLMLPVNPFKGFRDDPSITVQLAMGMRL